MGGLSVTSLEVPRVHACGGKDISSHEGERVQHLCPWAGMRVPQPKSVGPQVVWGRQGFLRMLPTGCSLDGCVTPSVAIGQN